jgi:hypothetical protein
VMHSKWTLPIFCAGMGAIMFGASAAGGKPGLGVALFVIMAVVGLVVLLGGASETVRGLRGDGRDERFEMVDLRATAFSGLVASFGVIGGFLFEIAHGRSGMPFTWLGALAGIAYVAAVVVLRLRG